jgi:anti-anti-sigma factor
LNAVSANDPSDELVRPDHRILHPRPGRAIVEIVGEHDLASRDTIQQLFLELVATNELVVIDISEATFIDSSFISAVIQAHKYAQERRTRLRLQLGTNQTILKVIELTRLAEHIDCVHSRDDALRQ